MAGAAQEKGEIGTATGDDDQTLALDALPRMRELRLLVIQPHLERALR